MLDRFFEANHSVLGFGYGLVFFVLGFGALLTGRAFRQSRLAVARSLPWLAAFGLLVGIAQWGVVFIPLQASYLSEGWLTAMRALQAILLMVAHGCLLAFGVTLTARWESVRWLLGGSVSIGAAACMLSLPWTALSSDWQLTASAVAAYGLGLPGAVLSARGLLLQRRDVAAFYPRSARSLLVAAWAFILSVPLGPLAVPLDGARPAWLLGVPVQVPLAAGGLMLAWSLLTGLEALRVEQARRIERAERREAMLEERYRLSKELNDGVIQDLFAVGMLLGSAPAHTVEQHLQSVVDRLRLYVLDLEPADPGEPEAHAGLLHLVEEFRANTLLPVVLDLQRELDLPADVGRAVLTVAREALSNVRRHARASLVRLSLRGHEGTLRLTIADNGRGMPDDSFARGLGIDHMTRAAEGVGGKLHIGSAPGGGAQIALELPDFTQRNTKHPRGA